jgi:hypothetical protein
VPGKKFTVERIVAKLREAEWLQRQGLTIPQLCKRLQICPDLLPVAPALRGPEGGRGPAPEGPRWWVAPMRIPSLRELALDPDIAPPADSLGPSAGRRLGGQRRR